MDDITPKKNMTDEERLALAEKLDKDLDDFIDGLERKRYTEGWPEDRWEEEMDKHPFFMKKPPEIGDEIHPLMEGIQQLKYDPEENTKEDLAMTYKDDGNFYMKHRKYRMAIYSYTEGLHQKTENSELNSQLYNNRSAAQYFLKNYRSSLSDALKSVSLNPPYTKAAYRAALCQFDLEKFDESVKICDEILQYDPKNQLSLDLRKKCLTNKAIKTRDERKRTAVNKKKSDSIAQTINIIESRGVKFEEQRQMGKKITEEMIKPRLGPLEDFPVHLDENGILVWPAAFCYPEFLFSDFQQKVSENVLLYDAICELFNEPLECDKQRKYSSDTVNVYYENKIVAKVIKVDLQKTIQEIVQEKLFLVSGGALTFYIVPKDSDTEKEYINMSRRPLLT